MVKISHRFDEGKSTKKSLKNLRYGPQNTVSKHLLKVELLSYPFNETLWRLIATDTGINIVKLKVKVKFT